jgi:Flp pilus assembly protein TadG
MRALLFILRRFGGDRRGIAAMEFVLLSPIMLVLAFGLAEVYVEHASEDQFTRYVHQAGDLLARETTLTTADITTMLDASDQMVPGFDSGRTIELHVASFGFKADNTATLLWERSAGGAPISLNATDVEGMGLPADTVIRVEARMSYTSPFNYVWSSSSREISSVTYFRPRETRAISMDGAISEYEQNWDYIPPSS